MRATIRSLWRLGRSPADQPPGVGLALLCLVAAWASACGSVPEPPCAEFVNPELQSAEPSVVRVAFKLSECGTEAPLADRSLSEFEVLEDGLAMSSFESSAAVMHDNRAFQQAVVLMLDVSGSVVGHLSDVKSAARSMVRGLSRTPQIALYTFDGRAQPRLWLDFTSDASAVTRAIEALPSETADPSTNLNGAVTQGLRILEDRRSVVEAQRVIYAPALAIFTDGTDRASRVSRTAALEAARLSDSAIFAVGLGSEIDEGYLRQLATRGSVALADEVDDLTEAFAEIGRSISAQANSHYVLAYCSPRRAGTHELTLSLKGFTGQFKATFDASGFSGGCSPEDFIRQDPSSTEPIR